MRATGITRGGHDVSKPQPPTWHDVGEKMPRPTAWGGARRTLAAKTITPGPPARACYVGRRPVLHGAKSAWLVHRSRTRCCDVPKPQPPTWRGVGEEEPRPTARGGARCALAAKTTTRSPTASAFSVGRRPVLHGAKRARAARHGDCTRWPRCFEAAAADLARCR